MTREERELLEITARSLLKLEHGIRDRVAGIEAILEAFFRHHGNTDMALARLTVQADLLKRHTLALPPLIPANDFEEQTRQ
jgi:hypothetical protein